MMHGPKNFKFGLKSVQNANVSNLIAKRQFPLPQIKGNKSFRVYPGKLSPLRLFQTKRRTEYNFHTCTLQEGLMSNAINSNWKCLWYWTLCFIQLWIAVTQYKIPKRCIYFWTACISKPITGLLSRPNVDMWQFYHQYVTVLLLRYNVTYVHRLYRTIIDVYNILTLSLDLDIIYNILISFYL